MGRGYVMGQEGMASSMSPMGRMVSRWSTMSRDASSAVLARVGTRLFAVSDRCQRATASA